MTACDSGLGMEDGSIPDNRITAASEYASKHGASNARLNRPRTPLTTGSWSAKTNDLNQWIQADLGDLERVSGVTTQGRNGGTYLQWVTKFFVKYSENGEAWSNVEDGNGQKVRIYITYLTIP